MSLMHLLLPFLSPPTRPHPPTHLLLPLRRLGPRKAAALLRAVMRAGGFVESRNQVWRELELVVFGNWVLAGWHWLAQAMGPGLLAQ